MTAGAGRRRPPARIAAGSAIWTAVMAAAGALQTLAFVEGRTWPLPIATAALLAWRVARVAPRRAAHDGFAYAFGWLGAGVWWLYISMHRYGGLPAWMAALAVAALAAALALYLALALAAAARWRSGRPAIDALTFGAVWLGAELARGVLFTGFPWLASGYAQIDGPLAGLAPWVGVYGIGAWAAVVAALAAAAWPPPGGRFVWRLLAAAALLVLLPWPFDTLDFTRSTGTLEVALVQTNVPQDQKFAAEHVPEVLEAVARDLLASRATLTVAPETAVPLLPSQLEELAPGYWATLAAAFGPERAALVGVPLGDFEHGYTNSVVALGGGSDGYRYDKWHLVPFGEFIPRGFRWFTELMQIPLGDFARGSRNPPSLRLGAQRIAPNICYEDLFGEELARRFGDAGAAPTLFANVGNIAWFGDTIAVRQHREISRLRTLEFQRPMLRATNTGATAIIDHRGRVVAELAPYTRGVLTGVVDGRSGITPYAWWASRAGLWPLALAAAGWLAVRALAARVRSAAAGAAR